MAAIVDPLTEANDALAEIIEATPAKRRGTLLIVDDEDGPRQSLRVIFKDDYRKMKLTWPCWTSAWRECRASKFWNASNM